MAKGVIKPMKNRLFRRRLYGGTALAFFACVYFGLAYVVVPVVWRRQTRHPALNDAPRTTVTAKRAPG